LAPGKRPRSLASSSQQPPTPLETETVKNRIHIDIHASGGRALPIETRRQRVDAEARRLADLGATVAGVLHEEGIDHCPVAMKGPEGTEFDIN
jgi:Glyoxalase-like domain